MATEEVIIIAIELGSSKVTGIGGKKLPDGSIEVDAVASESSSAFMRNGAIFNLVKSVACIKSIISQLEKQLKRNVTQVYVGNGGQGVHSIENTVEKRFDSVRPISREIVSELMNENSNVNLNNLEILEVVPQEYSVGTQKQIDPVGVLSDHIEGHFVNIVARPTLHNGIADCMKQVGINVVEYKCTPLTVADEVLSNDDKRSGCVLVDFGAETTTVSIYKSNLLRFVSVIPLGSANITKDIASLSLDENQADQLKISYGYVSEDLSEEEAKSPVVTLPDGEPVTKERLAMVIEARLEEILLNVKDQITASGYPVGALLGGAVLIGGGANLKNLEKAFKKITGISKVHIAKTTQTSVRFSKSLARYSSDSRLIAAISLLSKGSQSCTGALVNDKKTGGIFDPEPENPQPGDGKDNNKDKKPQPEPKEKKEKRRSFWTRAKNFVKDLSEKVAGEE